MNIAGLDQVSDVEWRLPPQTGMQVPGIIFASRELLEEMDDKVREQVANVATLPGIVGASLAMPDAHWGYGFPIGGVAAFDPDAGGIVSAGGVGFDISCGVRTVLTGVPAAEFAKRREAIAERLFAGIPAGVGSTSSLLVEKRRMERMLTHGARWAVEQGYGTDQDLERIEQGGRVAGADPDAISAEAKQRQADEVGTLGSGNHYLEVQEIAEIYDAATAAAFNLRLGEAVVSIHCGSRGLGHQIGTDYLKRMVAAAPKYGLHLPERELACAPLESPLGKAYFGAMTGGINCALANRQVLTHALRQVLAAFFPGLAWPLLYDVSHNTCKLEAHEVDGITRRLYVHRKGATRAFGPGHPELPPALQAVGQPVLIGGSMGTSSFVLVGTAENRTRAFCSACHGAGRRMSRKQATNRFNGKEIVKRLGMSGTVIRSHAMRGVAEEAPDAYKDVAAVVAVTEAAGLARKVARLHPIICVKG